MKVYKAKVVIVDNAISEVSEIANSIGAITPVWDGQGSGLLEFTGSGLFRKDKTIALFNGNVACVFGTQVINTITCGLGEETEDAIVYAYIEVAEEVAAPLEFKAFIAQAGTDDPIVKHFKNELSNYAVVRSEAGVYTLTFDEDILLADNTNVSISPDTDITLAVNGNELTITCDDDDVLTGSYLEITVYP